ncbi:unnamed protein product [Parnassius mnemosyne]|uniref:DDE Tnp4 domain-containing protein n=2 Tax=Parnassius mnemosyne TaxID=213953 RepID=A0AAV1LPT4_9NEOP
MNEAKFDELLTMVTPLIQKENTMMRDALPARVKLQIILRHLATGDCFGSLEALYRVPRCSISSFFEAVCEAIWIVLRDFIKVPQSESEWRKIMNSFSKMWNFPNCCGAMDRKLVKIRCPPNSASEYFYYKKNFSIILFAVVDANYNFIYIDVGTNGRANDTCVFEKSTLNEAITANLLNIPNEGVFVADDAFPLKTNILKPYNTRGEFNEKHKVFNYRLSRARRVVENAFGILVAKFRIFEKPIPLTVSKVEQLVKTTCALHSWLRKITPNINLQHLLQREDWEKGCIIPGERRQVPSEAIVGIPQTRLGNHTENARRVRNMFAEKFITTNIVPWCDAS